VYYVLEQAQIKGLCAPLSGIRPYSQSVVVSAINEILNSGNAEKLNPTERSILEQYLEKFAKPKTGFDWARGSYFAETAIGQTPLTADVRVGADIEGSNGNYFESGEPFFGTEIWLRLFFSGDIGRNLSYGIGGEGGLIKAPRRHLGTYNTYYEGFESSGEYQNELINVYSEPLTHFPYTYKKRWDGSVFFFNDLSGFDPWPGEIAGGYHLPAELTVSFFENKLIARMGRISHDWASTSFGSSLAFNQMARPFLALETEFNPVSWFGISSLTGLLEYYNRDGIKDSSMNFQNAFSITMMQFRYKNYIFLDIVDSVIWPKRFELGYMLPIISHFFYQNNVGDFDNLALTFNLKAQYPGLGNIWFSFFMDEMNFLSGLLTLDRQMFAFQGGLNVSLPLLSFSSLKFSYTRTNPYNYTHNRNFNPWYGEIPMETSYTNNGVGLGYYLPPNSDEILVRFSTMPGKNINTHFQYQLIRHGADFGSSAVDGSNLLSELDPTGRDDKKELKRFFLHDGAYQWMHIIKAGVEWNLSGLPVTFFGEAGVVFSYFTNIEEKANVTGEAHPYSVIDTSEYPKSTGIIVKIGFRLYPR
jgi:hypothetical protein